MASALMAKRSGGQKRKPKLSDIALVFDQTDDRQGYQILRRRAEDRPFEIGTIRPLEEGKPIEGEVVTMRRRKDIPVLFDVEVQLPETRRADGPAQVATEDYRRGWDAIWGRPQRVGKPN